MSFGFNRKIKNNNILLFIVFFSGLVFELVTSTLRYIERQWIVIAAAEREISFFDTTSIKILVKVNYFISGY